MTERATHTDILALTTDIVAAYVSNNTVPQADISGLIERVFRTLSGIGGGSAGVSSFSDRPAPAVPVKKSITPDYIICLEDAKKMKMLKRHLNTAYGLSPDEYRERWGLPADYPMTAPNYAKRRSALAKDIGLGVKKGRKKR